MKGEKGPDVDYLCLEPRGIWTRDNLIGLEAERHDCIKGHFKRALSAVVVLLQVTFCKGAIKSNEKGPLRGQSTSAQSYPELHSPQHCKASDTEDAATHYRE